MWKLTTEPIEEFGCGKMHAWSIIYIYSTEPLEYEKLYQRYMESHKAS